MTTSDRKSSNDRKQARIAQRSPVKVGDVVAGKYRVEQILAAGGMGVVAAARHEQLDQVVAIKVLLPEDEQQHAVARFLREARAAARIQSEHVARVFDVGTLDGGVPYLVMEHLSGRDLAHELRGRGPLPVSEAVELVLQALEGVAEAHAMGIVHRDLKPANLFLAARPGRPVTVKVLDFGISKVERGPNEKIEDDLTGTSLMLGSPRYMSPEQAQSSKTVDVRTDIWSMGVILYELLDGKSPFGGETMGEVIGKLLLRTPEPIRDKRPDVPEGLANVIMRCLQRDRELRYRNVAELALALGAFASARAQVSVDRITGLLVEGQLAAPAASKAAAKEIAARHASDPAVQLGVTRIDAQTARSWVASGTQDKPRSRWIYALAGVALVGVVSAGAWLANASRGKGAASQPDAPSPLAVADTAHPARAAPSSGPSAAPTATASATAQASAAPSASASASATAPVPATASPGSARTGTSAAKKPAAAAGPPARKTKTDILSESD